MCENENLMWHVDKLDLEAERIEFEKTLDKIFPVDRNFFDGAWEYVDGSTELIFRGWLQARLSTWLRASRQLAGGLLTDNIDSDELHEMANSWKTGGNTTWSDIIDHINDRIYDEVYAQIASCVDAEAGE